MDVDTSHESKQNDSAKTKSIILIGMRGAGKTTTGRWVANLLGWPFTDLDEQLEKDEGHSIPEIIEKSGWEGFRSLEVAALGRELKEKPKGHVFAAGGGIVETLQARKLLKSYLESGGLVILIQRNIEDIMAYLQIDKTRPAYVDDMRSVWERRRHWYHECSNHLHYSQKSGPEELHRAAEDLERFLMTISGKRRPLDTLKAKERSFFVSLTVPDVAAALDFLPNVVVGSDAVELRVDLLIDLQNPNDPPSKEYVANQLSILRGSTSLPIIFTVRTISQGGKFPDSDHDSILRLSQLALRMGVEFLDIEMHLPESILDTITKAKGYTAIIASHHDPKGTLSWSDGSWVPYYNKALLYGDIVKLVGIARDIEDNRKLDRFKSWAQSAHDTPIIAINMGRKGQSSRVHNDFMTPVSHPALPSKAAPGQLSASEIRYILASLGVIEPKEFFLFGKPIAQSRSPAMHNALFKDTGLPYIYDLFPTDNVADLEPVLQFKGEYEDFGGASVTIPLKLDIRKYLDSVSIDAEVIGAVNTIVIDSSKKNPRTGLPHLTGLNTDWKGMKLVLENAGAYVAQKQSGLVIGGGGTARAAIYTLRQMGFSPIYVLGRSVQKLQELVRSFPDDYNLKVVTSFSDIQDTEGSHPTVAIGTIPADKPIDPGMEEVVASLFSSGKSDPESSGPRKVLLEMAYKPSVTPLMELAQTHGWETIPGLEILAAQGVYQFEAWTGIMPLFKDARVCTRISYVDQCFTQYQVEPRC